MREEIKRAFEIVSDGNWILVFTKLIIDVNAH